MYVINYITEKQSIVRLAFLKMEAKDCSNIGASALLLDVRFTLLWVYTFINEFTLSIANIIVVNKQKFYTMDL